jgi:hypothetical protein
MFLSNFCRTLPTEYSARYYIEFNFPDFACEDSGEAAGATEGFPDASHKNKCIQNNLRFVRDADVVLNSADSPKWVVRLTETKKRSNGAFVKWRDEVELARCCSPHHRHALFTLVS